MNIKQAIWRLYVTIPEPIRHRIDSRRRLPYWRRVGVIFIHVPKAAGTSISHALYGRSLDHLKAREIRAVCPRDFDKLFTFTVVRNPWDRVLSAYRFARAGGTSVAGIMHARRYQRSQFRCFESFLAEWLVHQDLRRLDNIFQLQSDFILDRNGKQLVEHVGRVEALEPTIATLEYKLGYAVSLPCMNRLSLINQDFRSAYRSAESIELVSRIYQQDIANFRYHNPF